MLGYKVHTPENLKSLAAKIRDEGGILRLTGGAVRDGLRGNPVNDFDCVVFGISRDAIFEILRFLDWSYTVTNATIECSNGIDISVNENGSIYTDFTERDFSVNALYYDVLTGEISDPMGCGLLDLSLEILLPVYSEIFIDDPIRVFRAARMLSKNFVPDLFLYDATHPCAEDWQKIPVERIWAELEKFSGCRNNGRAFLFLDTFSILDFIFPAVAQLREVRQSPVYHPEGNALFHTLLVIESLPAKQFSKTETTLLLVAALYHDTGKISTTTENADGKIVSPGHAEKSIELFYQDVKQFLPNSDTSDTPAKIAFLIKHHMLAYSTPSKKQARRILVEAEKIGVNWRLLIALMEADFSGRTCVYKSYDVIDEWEHLFDEVDAANEIRPLFEGRHLISLGAKPSKIFGEVLRTIFDAQLEEKFSDFPGATKWFEENFCIVDGKIEKK